MTSGRLGRTPASRTVSRHHQMVTSIATLRLRPLTVAHSQRSNDTYWLTLTEYGRNGSSASLAIGRLRS
ncbi:MAG: hypothetical protein WBP75_11200 [Candidatus Cybelea sp.]